MWEQRCQCPWGGGCTRLGETISLGGALGFHRQVALPPWRFCLFLFCLIRENEHFLPYILLSDFLVGPFLTCFSLTRILWGAWVCFSLISPCWAMEVAFDYPPPPPPPRTRAPFPQYSLMAWV